jgi:two-component system response regulator RstA
MSDTRVLLVDDDKLLRQILRDSLEASGFEVATAGDGDEALRFIPEFNPDVIVMDVMMPGENGYRVCKAIKDLGSKGMDAPPKIVLLTGRRVDDEPEREAMFLQFSQADAMLYKPCEPTQVIATIARVLAE